MCPVSDIECRILYGAHIGNHCRLGCRRYGDSIEGCLGSQVLACRHRQTLPGNIVAIVGTSSRGGFIGLTILALAFWWKSKRKLLWLLLAVIVLPIENAPLNVGVPLAEAICKTVVGPNAADAGALPLPFRAVTLK